jgi:predicted nucleic acid-binding protein
MTTERFLVDASAIARCSCADVGERLDVLAASGVVDTCGVVDLQLLGTIHDPQTYTKVAALRSAAFKPLDTSEADFRRAAQVQALLVAGGQPGVAWQLLVVAAVAERYGVTVLCGDARYDLIGKVTGQGMERVG